MLIVHVSFPKTSSFGQEFILEVKVPVLVLLVELEVVLLRHVVHGQDAVVGVGRHIFDSGDS